MKTKREVRKILFQDSSVRIVAVYSEGDEGFRIEHIYNNKDVAGK